MCLVGDTEPCDLLRFKQDHGGSEALLLSFPPAEKNKCKQIPTVLPHILQISSLVIRAVTISKAGKRDTKMDGFTSRFSLMLAACGAPLRAPFAMA